MNQEDAPRPALPVLLADEPAAADWFGSHDAVAEAMAELITSKARGRCVALEGSWGSGKSTVLNILARKLDGRAQLFTFDTWGSQGDPLRFSFMEQLFAWAKATFKEASAKIDALEEQLELDKSKSQEEITEAKPVIHTEASYLALLLLIGTPVGYALLTLAWRLSGAEWVKMSMSVAGAVTVAAPLLYLVYLKLTGKQPIKKVRAVLHKIADETRTVVVKRAPIATSLVFSTKIRQLFRAIQNDHGKERLVIVFDNVDRVSETNSARVWSLLMALLDVVHDHRQPYSDDIWVLVPIDASTVPLPVSAADVSADPVPKRDQASLRARFVEKTFQLTVSVSPPLPTKWEGYFVECFNDAFRYTPEADLWQEVFAVFRHFQSQGGFVTPRHIKRFINDLGVLYRTRVVIDRDKRPDIVMCALYILKRDKIRTPTDVLSADTIPETIRHLIDCESPRAYLAALVFGVEHGQGAEILIAEQVGSVASGKSKSLPREFFDLPNFTVALAQYIDTHAASSVDTDPFYVARCFAVIKGLPADLAADVLGRIGRTTARMVRLEALRGELTEFAARGLGYLAKIGGLDSESASEYLATALSSNDGQKNEDSAEPKKIPPEEWWSFVTAYKDGYAGGEDGRRSLRVELPANASDARSLLRSGLIVEEGGLKFSVPQQTAQEISEALVNEFSTLQAAEGAPKEIAGLLATQADIQWEQVVQSMDTRLARHTPPIDSTQFERALDVLLLLAENADATNTASAIRGLLAGGHLVHHLQIASNRDAKCEIKGAHLLLATRPPRSSLESWQQSPNGLQTIVTRLNGLTVDNQESNAIFATAYSKGSLPELVEYLPTLGADAFRDTILAIAARQDVFPFTAENFCNHILPVLPDTSEELTDMLVDRAIEAADADKYVREKANFSDDSLVSAYVLMGRRIRGGNRKKAYFRRLGQALSLKERVWWIEAFADPSEALVVAAQAIDEAVKAEWLGESTRDALSELVLAENLNEAAVESELAVIAYRALDKADKERLVEPIIERAIASSGADENLRRVMILGGWALKTNFFRDNVRRFASSALEPAIKRGSAYLNWIEGLLGERDFVSAAPQKVVSSLRNAVEDAKRGDGDGETE